jgi:ferredoxin
MVDKKAQARKEPVNSRLPIRSDGTILDEFIRVFGVWEEAQPYLNMMVNNDEMQTVVRMGGRSLTAEQISEIMGLSENQGLKLIKQAYARCILNKKVEDGVTRYLAADFYTRLDQFAKYENWVDIPFDDRRIINQSFFNEFISRHTNNVMRKMQGLEAENALPNDTVMLLDEIVEMIGAATEIVVQPCDCRKLGENCDFPIETCIWLDDGARQSLDRGNGRRLTKEEAIELVRWADRKGLMHTADSEWKSRGLHAICNCCSCDCYPFQAAQKLGSKGVWPKSRYVAAYDPVLCNSCGACVKRCHFDAFYHDDSMVEIDGRSKKGIKFDAEKCWGCGLCANTCPENAIEMTGLVDLPQVMENL